MGKMLAGFDIEALVSTLCLSVPIVSPLKELTHMLLCTKLLF